MTPIPSATKNLAVLVTAMTLTVAACGGADSAPAKAPASERSTSDHDGFVEPQTAEEAQDQIARAKASLEGADKKAGDARPDAPKAPSPQQPQGGAATREERPEDTCSGPCRALASMRRAVDALCRITGDGDNRCVDAKRTLTESTTRVSSCRCEGR